MIKYILNDKLVDQNKAMIHVSDLALLRGYGIFDFFRLIGLKPLFLEDHLNRFYNSARTLRLECPLDRDTLRSMILEMIKSNKIHDSGVRIVLTGGESPNGYYIGEPTLIVLNEPIKPLPESHFTEGIRLVSHQYLRDIPDVKTLNYLMGIYHLPDIQAAGALDLLFHWNGKISELTRSNFFIVDQNDRIVTAGKGVLKGINRKHVLQLAREEFEVEERDIFMNELPAAREAFLTGTTKKVTPIVQIDDIVIGDGRPGPVTQRLQQMYDEYIEQYLKRY